jgi:hypothetical protein
MILCDDDIFSRHLSNLFVQSYNYIYFLFFPHFVRSEFLEIAQGTDKGPALNFIKQRLKQSTNESWKTHFHF